MVEQTVEKTNTVQAKPILKWAGGKTQMLNDLLPKVPSSYGRYIDIKTPRLIQFNYSYSRFAA